MANLAETSTYDAGVYQLETTDTATAGASGILNSPFKNLANRTNYLKAQVDALKSGTAGTVVSVISASATAVAGTSYVLTASLTLTLPLTPAVGAFVKFANRSGTSTCVVARNSQNIMTLAEDMTLDSLTAAGTLVFSDATRGWVLI